MSPPLPRNRKDNRMNFKSTSMLAVIVSSLAVISAPSHVAAQDSQKYAMEEVIVTAERRETKLQSTAISITAISGDTIREMGIQNAEGLQNIVPGLTIRSTAIGSSEFTIRGVGAANDDVSSDSGVGVYVDGIFMARTSSANLSLYDLERIEVLRGPQGTLYGRNTAGGSINIITSKPSDEFEGRFSLDTGNEGRFNAAGYVSGPLVEGKFFAKASIASFNRDGIMENIFDGSDGNSVDTLAGRVGIRYLPTENTEFLLTYDFEDSKPGPNLKSLGPNNGFENPGTTGPQPASNPVRSANVDNTGSEEFETSGVTATLNIDFEPATLSFIVGHRTADTFFINDFDRGPDPNVSEVHDEEASWTSTEVRLTSNPDGAWSAGGRLNWTGGLYFFEEDSEKTAEFQSDVFAFVLCNFVFPPFACPGVAPGTFSSTGHFQRIETKASAVFGQVNYALTDRFSLTAGLRYTEEDKDFTSTTINIGPLVPPFNPIIDEEWDCSGNRSFDNVSGKLVLDFQKTDNSLIYASISQGYRSGGFSGGASNELEACGGFGEETATAYEVGAKVDWADGRVRTNVSVFFTDYEDLQVSVIQTPNGVPTTTNAANADITGVEFEFQAFVTDQFRVHGNVAVLDATFRDFLTFTQGVQVDRSGDNIASVPELTYNLGFEWTIPVRNGGNVRFRGDYIWEDETENFLTVLPQWEVANFRLAYAPSSEKWEVSAWIRNAFDELYWTTATNANTTGLDAVPRSLAEPRTYGVSFNYHLGG